MCASAETWDHTTWSDEVACSASSGALHACCLDDCAWDAARPSDVVCMGWWQMGSSAVLDVGKSEDGVL
jgi:hypothetical protein